MWSRRTRAAIALLVLSVLTPAAMAWSGRPVSPPPKPPNVVAPPPAWSETQSRSMWLAFGSYCWNAAGKATCVDMIPPETMPGLPLLSIKRGATVRVHFGFRPRSVEVAVGTKTVKARLNAAKRLVSWRASRGGVAVVFTRPTVGGDASYVARIRLR
jgi:hypothetical protein